MEEKRLITNVDNHAINLVRNIASLFNVNNIDNKFSDVRIEVENTTFYCHKMILQLNSEYLGGLAFRSGRELLQNIKPDVFYDVLQFAYTGEIYLSTDNVEFILSAAHRFGMDNLKKVCFRFLNMMLNLNTVQFFDRLATYYNNNDLKRKCKKLIKSEFAKLQSSKNMRNVSSDAMKLMLSDDSLEVKSETEVCDTLLKWLQVQWDVGNEVHPDEMLQLIRWSGIDIDYVKSILLPSSLFADQESRKFLINVVSYLTSGVQFRSLRTFHRPSTGVENYMITFGLVDNNGASNKLCRISLQHPDNTTTLNEIPTTLKESSSMCLLRDTIYVSGIGEPPYREVWKWNLLSGWIRCADMINGRVYHCSIALDLKLFVMGGSHDYKFTADNTRKCIESYDTRTDKWSLAGELSRPVKFASCVAYKNSIYVFGGLDKDNCTSRHIQVFNPIHQNCIFLPNKIPPLHGYRKEPLIWETSVIMIGAETCFIYNFESQVWQERKQFKAGTFYFSATLDNGMIYLAGGGVHDKWIDGKQTWIETDEVKCIPVLDIIEDKTANWQHHAKMPKPGRILAFTTTPPVSLNLTGLL